jgi:hypothetical protein
MPIRSTRLLLAAVAAFAALSLALPEVAAAQAGRKKTEGCMVSYDGSGKLVVKNKSNHKDMTFDVKQATSVLDKEGTVATKNGRKAQLADLEPNRPLIVYWKDKNGTPFATKVDAPDPIDNETKQLDKDIMEESGCKME